MYIFNAQNNPAAASVLVGLLTKLGIKYSCKNMETPPTIILSSKSHKNEVLGHHLDDPGVKQFIRSVTPQTSACRVYSGDEEALPFVLDVLSSFHPDVDVRTLQQYIDNAVNDVGQIVLTTYLTSLFGDLAEPFVATLGNEDSAKLLQALSKVVPLIPDNGKTKQKVNKLVFSQLSLGAPKQDAIKLAKPKKQAAGFNKTKASKLAVKPVRQGKIRLARGK